MQEPIRLDPPKPGERLKLFSEAARPDVDPVNAAISLVGIEGAANDILKNSTGLLDCLGTLSGYPCLAIVDNRRHDFAPRVAPHCATDEYGRKTALSET